jgi:hypothetical protein
LLHPPTIKSGKEANESGTTFNILSTRKEAFPRPMTSLDSCLELQRFGGLPDNAALNSESQPWYRPDCYNCQSDEQWPAS